MIAIDATKTTTKLVDQTLKSRKAKQPKSAITKK